MTEIANWLTEIGSDAAPDELDATTFVPNATQPVKVTLFGAVDRTYTLTGLWNSAVETFFSNLELTEDVPYSHGPLGDTAGMPEVTGQCNVGAWSGPQQQVNGLVTFSITVKPTSRVSGVAA